MIWVLIHVAGVIRILSCLKEMETVVSYSTSHWANSFSLTLFFYSMFENDEISESDKFFVTLPRPLKLVFALYNTMVSKSEMLCYFVIILNHIVSASFLSLILPILIFLWAMLSVPRPSKRFWMTAIIYTEVEQHIIPLYTGCDGLGSHSSHISFS